MQRRWQVGGRVGVVLVSVIAGLAIGGCASAGSQRDPALGYEYRLEGRQGVPIAVELDRWGFAWPQLGEDIDTVVLGLQLQRSRSGEPAIVTRAGSVRLEQVFERGARGARLVDLSPLVGADLAAGTRVDLEGRGVRWRRGIATLWGFDNAELTGQRVLVLAPHPDDAEIAAFGLYSATDADVVTVTSGDAGAQQFAALYPDPGTHYRAKGWLRTLDSLTVPLLGGLAASRVRNLGYYDATLGAMRKVGDQAVEPQIASLEDPSYYRRLNHDSELRRRPFDATWPGLVEDVGRELERVRPDIVVAPHPMLDVHGDHKHTTYALSEALAAVPRSCELYLYTNHAVGAESFPFGPREAMAGWPPWPATPEAIQPLPFARLYSHPLSAETQRRKLLALEAMHDLRTFDLRGAAPVAGERASTRRRRRLDYYRRAPRPVEIFFVLPCSRAGELLPGTEGA